MFSSLLHADRFHVQDPITIIRHNHDVLLMKVRECRDYR
jgi:hypothetical protein